MKELSVIIVTYEKIDIVRDCLSSIAKYNDIGDALEVIISDNSEDDVLYETVKNEFPWVKIIKNKNEGFGAGNNRGYEISSGKYLLFLNPDTILVEPIFQFAINRFDKENDLALFGLQLLDRDFKKSFSFYVMDQYGIMGLIKSKFAFLFNKYVDGKMFIAGADLFVRKSSFEQAGFFDENIFMYKEEADLIKRIKLYSTSKKTAFFKQKKIIHLEGGTENNSNYQRKVVLARRIIQTDKYYCNKYLMSYAKVLKQRIRQAKFKLMIYWLIGKRSRAAVERRLIQEYRSALEQ